MTAASAPASSANLGPGYDVLALALAIRCRVEVEHADRWQVNPAVTGGETLVRAAAQAADPRCGPLRVEIGGSVPIGRGLGSSAAVIVATMAAVRSTSGDEWHRPELAAAAARVEGHPDNVAAAVHGGLIAVGPGGRVHQLGIHPSLRAVVAVPDATLPTVDARRATAGPVETGVAARTAARLGFLVEGLRTGDAGLLAESAGDELHEARRAGLSPLTVALVAAARSAGALHAAWSGAGPSALALVGSESDASSVRSVWEEMLTAAGGSVFEPEIDRIGVALEQG
jgi:homoserine kinase